MKKYLVVIIIVDPNEVGNYRVLGSVCLSVCMFVCLPHFSDMVRPRELVFGTIVGYRSQMKPIDFGVNGYVFKVKFIKIIRSQLQHHDRYRVGSFFNITDHGRGQYMVDII